MNQLHDGHRARLREMYRTSNSKSFPDHLLLELLLSYAIPRKDVNPLAHQLLKAFGSLTAVLSATDAELHSVSGVGEQTITLIRLVFDLHNRMNLEPMLTMKNKNYLKNPEQAGRYLLSVYANERYETLRLLCFDTNQRLLHTATLAIGSKNEVGVEMRHVIENALFYHATSIILVHNHPSGRVTPSIEDIDLYHFTYEMSKRMDLILRDSIIVGDRSVYSFTRDVVFMFPTATETVTYTLSEYNALLEKGPDAPTLNELARAAYNSKR